MVAMESALEDKRWEVSSRPPHSASNCYPRVAIDPCHHRCVQEAAFLRNELTALIDKVPEQKLQDA